jgi:DNA primase
LLGQDLDLRELQRTGRIGRIEVEIKTKEGKTSGKIKIPSSLDSSETSLIAASLETIERIGPYDAKIEVKAMKDVRESKRDFVLKRAEKILKNLVENELPATSALTEKVKETIRASQAKEFEGLLCGPDVPDSDEIIIVEGRADVLNLLKNGIKNVITTNGARVPQPILNLSKEKLTTLFVDGDRGGELIIKEFTEVTEIDYIARAPEGKEVEELSKKEIFKALREKTPVEQHKTSRSK